MYALSIKAIAISIGCVLTLIACGPSEAEMELANLKFKMQQDSILQVEREHKQLLVDSISSIEETLNTLERSLIEGKAELATAVDRVNSVSEFQFGRTQSEREDQIRKATMAVEELKLWVRDVEEKIETLEEHKEMLIVEVNN